MLRLVLGRSGSGKTEYIRAELAKLAAGGAKKLMLIVPEQISFENERAMLRILGARNARKVHVTSFSRLADAAFRTYGGFAGTRLDGGGRSMFMSLALGSVKDKLRFYRKNAESTELVNLMLDTSAELKMCAVTPEALSAAASKLPPCTLKQKITEISLILAAYDALVAQSCADPLDDLTKLKNILSAHHFFNGFTVMIDSFQSFTVQEYGIINLILAQAEDLYVALCADGMDDREHGMGLFSIVKRTAHALIKLAGQNGAKTAPPVMLQSQKRFSCEAAAALEAGIYRPVHVPYEGDTSGVEIYEAGNIYEEASFVCASIRDLVMHKNYRYRDFAVIARSTGTYEGIIDTAMSRWEIPFFMDMPEKIDAHPLMRLVLSAFNIAQYSFRSDDIFSYLKTGLAGLSYGETAQLENYVFIWNISGRKWKEEWTDSPRGFTEKTLQSDVLLLKELNSCREKAIRPLVKFAESTADTDGLGMAKAVFSLLCDIKAAESLREFAHSIAKGGEPAVAQNELRLWDMLMDMLDQTVNVLGKTKVTRKRYAELLRLVINSSRMASIPQGLDEVTVGAANRIRTNSPKVVFVIGAVQGGFPLSPGENNIFSDGERRELISLGLPLNDTAEGAAVQERFLAYKAVSSPSERLYISYPSSDAKGSGSSPSSIVSETCLVLKNIKIKNSLMLPLQYFASAKKPAFETAARIWRSNDGLSASLKKIFASYGGEAHYKAVERAAGDKVLRFADKAKSKEFFGGSTYVSASQAETFYLCRFQYFCRYGIKAEETRAAELNALEYGSLMHFLLENVFRNTGSKKIASMNDEELKNIILGCINMYAEKKLGGLENRTPRFAYLVSRLADAAQVIIRHIAEELSQSEFVPRDFELGIGSDIKPLSIPLPDGGSVSVNGKIDRVDIMDKGGVKYVRIIDYKTGKKEFRLSDIIYGMNMQMLIYLAAICENGRSRYGETVPAGVLYMPASRPSVSAARGEPAGSIEKEAAKQLKMDGLITDNPEVIRGMEKNAAGKYIPASLKDGIPSKTSSVASPEELKSILKYTKDLIYKMSVELQSGDIQALPLTGKYDACAWCPYAPVCGHENGDAVREMESKWDKNKVMEFLCGEGTENGR